MVTEKGRGSEKRKEMVEHGILCALALSKKMKVVVKNYKSEEDQHKALKHWLEEKPTVTPHAKGERKRHYDLVKRNKEKGKKKGLL